MSFSPLLFDASFEFNYSKYHANPYKKGLMAAAMEKSKRIPWRGILALIGGFLIQLTLGSFYSFGNMMTYMTSYMRKNGSPNLTYGDFIVVQSVWGITQGVIMPLSGFIIKFLGVRQSMFIGCTIFSVGTALTYFTLNQSLEYVALTYGFISAFGQGIALIPTMTIGMRWFPNRKGMAMGVVVGGFGGGAFIFNQIQTVILNPGNISPDPDDKYFTDEDLLSRVPGLMLILGAIYFIIQMLACCMVTEPPQTNEHLQEKLAESTNTDEDTNDCVDRNDILMDDQTQTIEDFVTPKEALKCREFYMLWLTRFCAVLITQTVSGFYKAFGQTFIADDHFLSLVGAVSSVFNCTGRLFYGLLMDRSSYKVAMLLEMTSLTILVASLPVTQWVGKIMFATCIWLIYFTFPGTFSTQPAVTTQTFGHKYGGTIYGFLFTSDIVNNFLVGTMSHSILQAGGWTAMFLVLALFSTVAFIITLLFPRSPNPELIKSRRPQRLPVLDPDVQANRPTDLNQANTPILKHEQSEA